MRQPAASNKQAAIQYYRTCTLTCPEAEGSIPQKGAEEEEEPPVSALLATILAGRPW